MSRHKRRLVVPSWRSRVVALELTATKVCKNHCRAIDGRSSPSCVAGWGVVGSSSQTTRRAVRNGLYNVRMGRWKCRTGKCTTGKWRTYMWTGIWGTGKCRTAKIKDRIMIFQPTTNFYHECVNDPRSGIALPRFVLRVQISWLAWDWTAQLTDRDWYGAATVRLKIWQYRHR